MQWPGDKIQFAMRGHPDHGLELYFCQQPCADIAALPALQLDHNIKFSRLRWNFEKFGKTPMAHTPDIQLGIRCLRGQGQKTHRLNRRQNNLVIETMISKPGLDRHLHRNTLSCHQPGNYCQREMVLASTSTGMLLVFTAQWRVNPVQTISPLSALVIR